MIRVEGVEQAVGNLLQYSRTIENVLPLLIEKKGNEMIQRLKDRYPQIIWQGNFFPSENEFWVLGNAKLICRATGKPVDVNTESQVGRRSQKTGSYAASPQTEVLFLPEINLKLLANEFGAELAQEIRMTIQEILS